MRTTLFVERFTVLDYAFLDPVLGVRGESLQVSAELDGTLDAHGFILDFGPAKRLLKRVVDESLDHRCLIARHAQGVSLAESQGARRRLVYAFQGGELSYACPEQGLALLDSDCVNVGAISATLVARARASLPANVAGLRLRLFAEPEFEGPQSFRYTHGLKHHDGNCQRLLHGHSSRVEARVDGVPDLALAAIIAGELAEAHFANAADVEEELVAGRAAGLQLGRRGPHLEGAVQVAYRSAQGRFEATLPRRRLILLDREPSVENIAALAHELGRAHAGLAPARLAVSIYEGFGKGARAAP